MCRVVVLAFAVLLPSSLGAQVATSQVKGNPNAPGPRWDIFAGYSMLDPRGTYYPVQPDGSVLPVSFKVEKTGLLEAATFYFTRNVGLQVESGQHDLFTNTGFKSTGSSNSGIFTIGSGLIYRWPGVHLTPFVHGLGGGADVDGPDHEPYTWGPIIVAGGGLDWYFGCHNIGIRLFEADYEYLHANSGVSHGSLAADNFVWADDENINAIRLAAGLVFRGSSFYGPVSGCGPMPPPVLACAATPDVVFQGEPVTITATASGLNPKQTVTYTWSGPGVSGSGEVLTVPTDSLAPGTYTVKATVQEGTKSLQSASCETSFAVRPWEPPTLTCDASPLTIHPNENSTITLTARSPQNLPLTYECKTDAGPLVMNGNTATLSGIGMKEGPVTVNCSVKDNKGHSANCNASVTIKVPPPPNPHVKLICSIEFSRDAQHPTRVDNEAKACLDQVALDLQQQPDAKVVVVGESTSAERTPKKHQKVAKGAEFAAQRAVNTKEYLVTDKGIDATRISVATGSTDGDTVENYLVPSGATFTADVNGTNPVDESMVKPQVRKPLGAAPEHHHKKAAESTASPK